MTEFLKAKPHAGAVLKVICTRQAYTKFFWPFSLKYNDGVPLNYTFPPVL